MKKLAFTLTVSLGLITLFACSKDKTDIASIVEGSNWRISYFEDSGQDETYHFSGYTFSFNEGGTLTATNGSNTVNGTWYHSSSDDSNEKLIIDMGSSEPWDELEDDWHVIEKSDNKIRLEDVSGGDGTVEKLHFDKV